MARFIDQVTCCLMNWKTSAAGLLLVGLGLCSLFGLQIDNVHTPPETLLISGFGLIFAKDAGRK